MIIQIQHINTKFINSKSFNQIIANGKITDEKKLNLIRTIFLKTVDVIGCFDFKSRKRLHTERRQVIMYLILKRFTDYSLTQNAAGEVFNYSHGNSAKGAENIENLISVDKKLKLQVELIELKVREALKQNKPMKLNPVTFKPRTLTVNAKLNPDSYNFITNLF